MSRYLEEVSLSNFVGLDKRSQRRARHKLKKMFFEDYHRIDSNRTPEDRKLYKFWKNRRTLFTLIDSGNVYMTHELWYSVTPESVATFTACFLRQCLPEAKWVIDVFCGGGGNTIQLAKMFDKTYGIDYNIDNLYCAFQNAKCYGVEDRIKFCYGDWENALRSTLHITDVDTPDCIFASPPWGGVQYLKHDVYDLEKHLQPVGLRKLLSVFFSISENVVLFLPRNSDLDQLSQVTFELLGPDAKCKVVYTKQNGYMKGILAFWGKSFYDFSEHYQNNGTEASPNDDEDKDNFKDLY